MLMFRPLEDLFTVTVSLVYSGNELYGSVDSER